MSVEIRSATADDQEAIVSLVRSERLNPTALNWANFVVAVSNRELVGAAQIRQHKDGSRELGSLVVHRLWRGQGVASRLIETLLASEQGRVLTITGQTRAAYFARWGFRPIEKSRAPAAIRFHYNVGSIGGGLFSLFQGRSPNRLVILDRMPVRDLGSTIPQGREC